MLVVIGDLVEDVVAWRGAGATGRLEVGTDNAARITRSRGGSGANVAAAAARRMPTRFIGRVGADALGEELTRALAAADVDVRAQREGVTGTIVVLVDGDGERTFVTDRGAAAELGPIDPAWLAGADALHLPLYGLVEPGSRAACLAAAALVREAGGFVSVDLSSTAAIRDIGATTLHELLRELRAAVVLANAAEAGAAALDAFPAAPDVALVIKRGAEPVQLRVGGRLASVPVPRIDAVRDTTGAGDAFAAGYLAARIAGHDHEACAAEGIALASRALRLPGAALG